MLETFEPGRGLNVIKSRPLRILFQALLILFTMALFISFFGATSYEVQGVSLKAYVKPSLDGQSYLKLPPLGDLSADTHKGALNFYIELTGIHPEIIEEGFTLANSQEEWIGSVQSEAKRHLTLFVLKQVLLGACGAALVYFIVFRPKWKQVLSVFLLSLGFVTLIFGYSVSTYDMEAFKQPHYEGVVAAGPEVLHLADQLYDKFQNFKGTTDEVVKSINTLFSNIDSLSMLSKPDEEEVQILVVSDISNNPVGIELVETLVTSFKVDMVIDAGDLTDFGSPLEAQTFGKIGALGVPYLFAPGNHDSPEVTAFLGQFPNVKILEGSVVESHGLSVLGVPDPWSFGPAVNGYSETEIQRALEEQAETLRSKLEENNEVDIAVIHNPAEVDSLEGLAPIIISGHTHKLSVRRTGSSLFLNPGTTGASGFRGLQTEEMSYSALILHLGSDAGSDSSNLPNNSSSTNTQNRSVIDIIQYDPLSSSFTAQRRLF
ncbi:MAG: metallophosphoesterase [Bacillota bacterium]